jgi:hypothetical protein
MQLVTGSPIIGAGYGDVAASELELELEHAAAAIAPTAIAKQVCPHLALVVARGLRVTSIDSLPNGV